MSRIILAAIAIASFAASSAQAAGKPQATKNWSHSKTVSGPKGKSATAEEQGTYNLINGQYQGTGSVTGPNGQAVNGQTAGTYDPKTGQLVGAGSATGPGGKVLGWQTQAQVQSGQVSGVTTVTGPQGQTGTAAYQGTVDPNTQQVNGTVTGTGPNGKPLGKPAKGALAAPKGGAPTGGARARPSRPHR